ncbi:MAG TPA: CBS domain-containing protein [Nitrososphaerales archaeon]|nr:CBS domain-containing protein [Nitrososphaerales archaeon]
MPERASDLWWLFSRQTVCITQKESVLNAAILMQKRNFRHLPVVTEAGKIVGVLSAQDIVDSLSLALRPGITPSEVLSALEIPVLRIMALHPIVVEKGDGLFGIVRKIIANNIGALPVVDEMGVVQGIITLRDLVGLLGTSSEPLGVRITEIMTTKISSISEDSTMVDAVHLMSEMRVRRLPVISGRGKAAREATNGSVGLLGMITNKDVLRLLARLRSQQRADLNSRIPEIMTRDVVTASRDEDCRVAASRMMIFGIGGLAIYDDESPICGLVTERDLIRRLADVRSVNFLVNSMKFELELLERERIK